jgi:hypothetical protein
LDHEQFLNSLAMLLRYRHRVVFIAGNHDLQMNFPGVRALLTQRIIEACQRNYPSFSVRQLKRQIKFFPWYYHPNPDVHIEHGSQYDPYCSVPDPAWPFRIDKHLQINVSALMLEHLMSKVGYFNPNVESTFVRTPLEYLEHWARYYLRTPRLILGSWLLGTLRVVWETAWARGLSGPGKRMRELQSLQEAAHSELFALANVRDTMRVLYVDRMLLLAGCALTALMLSRKTYLGALSGLGLLALYRVLRQGRGLDPGAVSEQVDGCARLIAPIYGARAVVFGHTHKPQGQWEGNVFYGNSGTWAPMHRDVACTIQLEESRPFVWLWQSGRSLHAGLYRFHNGHLIPAGGKRAKALRRNVTPKMA